MHATYAHEHTYIHISYCSMKKNIFTSDDNQSRLNPRAGRVFGFVIVERDEISIIAPILRNVRARTAFSRARVALMATRCVINATE